MPSRERATVTRNRIEIDAPPPDVFAILLDPECYGYWVVGSKEIRAVDPEWPAKGAAFHHSVGTEAGELKDRTEIIEIAPPELLRLRAYVRPAGIMEVTIRVRDKGGRSEVVIEEVPSDGTPPKKVESFVSPLIYARNLWSLRRLRKLVRARIGQ